MAKPDGVSMPEGPERSLFSLLRETGDALEAAAPPFDAALGVARLAEAARARRLLRSGGVLRDDTAVIGAELEALEEEAPSFDVEAGANRLRQAALDRGLLSDDVVQDLSIADTRTVQRYRVPDDMPSEFLITRLNKLRQDVGNPSLAQIARLSHQQIAKSTLDDYLSGRRAKRPSWRLVQAYVTACHAVAASIGIDFRRLETLEDWYIRWESATTRSYDESAAERDHNANAAAQSVLQRIRGDLSELQSSLPASAGILIVTSGPGFGTFFDVLHKVTTIGRAPESDIWLNDPRVSRRHAEIRRNDAGFTVHDNGSRNGTFLKGKLVTESLLSSYDELQIGAVGLVFVQGTADSETLNSRRYRIVRSRLIKDMSHASVEA